MRQNVLAITISQEVVVTQIDSFYINRTDFQRAGEKFPDTVKRAIKSCIYDGCPGIQTIASKTNVSVRTLQRKLARAGVTYSELRIQARFELATEMLADEDTKIIDIAYELGYEDPSNFSRAFRHMVGTSPRQFRASAQLS